MTDESLLASLLKGMQEQLTKQTEQLGALNTALSDVKPVIQDHETRIRVGEHDHATHEEVAATVKPITGQIEQVRVEMRQGFKDVRGDVRDLDKRVEKIEHSRKSVIASWVKSLWSKTWVRVATVLSTSLGALIAGLIMAWLHLS